MWVRWLHVDGSSPGRQMAQRLASPRGTEGVISAAHDGVAPVGGSILETENRRAVPRLGGACPRPCRDKGISWNLNPGLLVPEGWLFPLTTTPAE